MRILLSGAVAALCLAFVLFFGIIAIALLFPAHNSTSDPLLTTLLAISVISFMVAAVLGIVGIAVWAVHDGRPS